MSFASIQGIPPLPPVVGPRPPSDVTRVFATEFSRQQREGTEAHQESRRGLEADEDLEKPEAECDTTMVPGIHIVI